MTVTDAQIEDCLMSLVKRRGPEKTICPSEVAHALSSANWRSLMPQVWAAGIALVNTGQIVVTQKGQVVDPTGVKGPIRYRLKGQPPIPQ